MEKGDTLAVGNGGIKWTKVPFYPLFLVIIATLIVIGPISALTILEGIPSRGVDSCDGCHGGKYDLVINDPVITAPGDIDVGEDDKVTISIDVTADGTNSYWQFDMTVKLVSVNSRVYVSSQVTFNNQRPSGSSQPYRWTKDVVFDISGLKGGPDTLRAEAILNADHFGNTVKRTDTSSITVINDPPELSEGRVSPGSGDTDSIFTFEVTYKDINGDIPSPIFAVIDDTKHTLTPMDGSQDSIKTGEKYSASIKLGIGDHSFHFEATDGSVTVRFPETGEISGPTVARVNTPPILSDPDVSPGSGNCNDTFRFSITYTDPEGDTPSGEGLVLILEGMRMSPAMSQVGGNSNYLTDGDVSNGERYEIELNLDCGDYDFSINVSDGQFQTEVGPFPGPLVSEEPVISASIISPEDGTIFPYNTTITFDSNLDSNVFVTDAVYLWKSNISGIIGNGPSFDSILEPGSHTIILNVSSSEWGIYSEESITLLIEEEVVFNDLILGFSPTGRQTVNEGMELRFEVLIDMERFHDINATEWLVDDEVGYLGGGGFVYRPGNDDAGEHIVTFILLDIDSESVLERIDWIVDVLDVKVEIIITGEIDPDLGEFNKKEYLHIVLPVKDPSGRDLNVDWSVGNRIIDTHDISLDLKLHQGPWGQIGEHNLTARVTNPDGDVKWFNFTYTVLEEEIVDPIPIDPEDGNDTIVPPSKIEDDDNKGPFSSIEGDLGAGMILFLGVVALLASISWSFFVLVRPYGPKVKNEEIISVVVDEDDVEEWD